MAGCFESGPASSKNKGSAVPPAAPAAEHSEETGAIRGFVYDEELVSIAGAEILLLPANDRTSSAQDGSFSFSNIDPGSYTLVATRLGYASATTTLTVQPGSTVRKDLTLARLVYHEPHFEVHGPFAGFLECHMATPYTSGTCGFLPLVGQVVGNPLAPLFTRTKNYFPFNLTGEDWQNILIEARWTPSTFATKPEMRILFSYTNRTGTHWFANSNASQGSASLLYVRGDSGPGGQLPDDDQPKEPNLNITLLTWLSLPFGDLDDVTDPDPVRLAYEIRFEIAATVFYSQKAPESYSAFG